MKANYNASETLGLIADKVTGPYRVYQNHQRPGASAVDANGGHQVKSLDENVLSAADMDTDKPGAFGDRVGQLIADPYSVGADGKKLEKPAAPSYPESIKLYDTSNGGNPTLNGNEVNQPAWATKAGWNLSGDASFGTSATGGNGDYWDYQLSDLQDDLHLSAKAVRMTDWDTSAWLAAQAKKDPSGSNGNLSTGTYVKRYPAVKTNDPATEGKFAAGVDGSAYIGKTVEGTDAVVYPKDAPANGGSTEPTFTQCAGDKELSYNVSYQEGSTGSGVCDGVDTDASRWSTYPQANGMATFSFAQGYVKGGKVTVHFSEQAPDGIRIEGRTSEGQWKQLGSTGVNKKLGTYDVSLNSSISFDQIRVTMQGQWMKADEITVAGYATIGQVALGGITYGDDNTKIPGFDTTKTSYTVSVSDPSKISAVKAVSPQGSVVITQPTKDNGYTAVITLKSKDGSVVKKYTVAFVKIDDSAKGAYDPNVKDGIFPEVGPIDASKTLSNTLTFDKNKPSDGTADKPAAPMLSPRLDENNRNGVLVLRGNSDPQKADAIYATNTTAATYGATIWMTNDGSDPTDPNNSNRIAYNSRWNPYPIVMTKDNAGSDLVDGEFTIKAATQTGNTDTNDIKYSDVVSQTFRYAAQGTDEYNSVPIFQPVSTHPSGNYQNLPGYQEVKVFEPSYGTEVYYTMDGSDPTPARYGQNIGYGSRDYTFINDTVESGGDGKAYFVTAADDQYMRVWQLNDNMTGVVSDKEYDLDIGKHREAPQLIRGPHGNHLYLFTSGQSGWYKNQAEYQRTTGQFVSAGFDNTKFPRDKYGYRDGGGAWTRLQPFADDTTYNSQVGGVYNLGTKDEPNYLFSGSHWVVNDLEDSFTIWLPMTIDDDAQGPGAESSDKFVSVAGRDDKGQPTTSSFPVYESEKGLVTVKYSGKVNITVNADGKGSATTDPTEENISFAVPNTYADLKKDEFKPNPDNHTPRVIDYQQEQQFDPNKCDIPDSNGWQTCTDGNGKADAAMWTDASGYILGHDDKPLKNSDGSLIRDPSQVSDPSLIKKSSLKDAGIARNYSLKTAFDGKDWDADNYDGNEELYQGTDDNFYITLDLGQKRDLKTMGLSFKSVGGSDNAHRYGIYATNDVDANGMPTNWQIIANNKMNLVPGFQGHNLDGDSFRYVKYQNVDNVDMAHNKTGQAWSRGLYELTLSATKTIKSDLDVSALEKNINQGSVLVGFTDRYTEDSIRVLQNALTSSQNLLTALQSEGQNTKHTQQEIDASAKALDSAINGLVARNAVDKEGLKQTIDIASSVAERGSNVYTADSLNNLTKAIAEAKKVLNDNEASQDRVDAASKALADAVNSLVVNSPSAAVDVHALSLAVQLGNKNLSNANEYTAQSVKALSDAVDQAQKVLDAASKGDDSVTQSVIDKCTAEVIDAVIHLEKKPNVPLDYSSLKAALDQAQGKLAESSKYTDESVKALQSAVDAGKSALASATRQQQIDDATKAVTSAINGLQRKDPDVPGNTIDVAELNKVIEQAQGLNPADYTPDSWSSMTQRLSEALAVQKNPTSQDAVNNAVTQLQKAINALVRTTTKPVTPAAGGSGDRDGGKNQVAAGHLSRTGSSTLPAVLTAAVLAILGVAVLLMEKRHNEKGGR